MDVLITDEPQAELRPDGTASPIHLPNVGPEATAIKAAFGVRAQRASKISVARLGELLRGKQIWFCPAHGDAMLHGEPVLAFERDGQLEVVSIDTLVNTVRPHVKSGQLKLVVLTGCCTSRLALALHERAGVPDVIAWETKLEDRAGKAFGASFAEVTARQLLHGGRLDPKAAFEAACTAVTTLTEPGTLDNGHAGLVQQFELFVDPKDSTRVLQATGRLITGPGQGRIAAGTPVHVTALPAHGLAP